MLVGPLPSPLFIGEAVPGLLKSLFLGHIQGLFCAPDDVTVFARGFLALASK